MTWHPCRFLSRLYVRFCRMVENEQPKTQDEIKWWSLR